MSTISKIVEKCHLCHGSGLVDGDRKLSALEQWNNKNPSMPETCPWCDGKGQIIRDMR